MRATFMTAHYFRHYLYQNRPLFFVISKVILKSLYVLWFMGVLERDGSTTEEKKQEKSGQEWSLENILLFSQGQ
jgi:hypothetical protein